jgi:hypothetical protein
MGGGRGRWLRGLNVPEIRSMSGLSRALRIARSAGLWASLALAPARSGCGRTPADATPEGVVREVLERLERVQGDPRDARAVFDLLSRSAQTNLSDRARRASAATGKRMGPEQMLAPSHYFPRFQPRQWSSRSAGNRAVVEVIGLDPSTERAQVPCVLEEGRWRIDLALPPLPPIERRPGADPR